LHKAEGDENKSQRETLFSVLDIHADLFISVAFGRAYSDEKWAAARNAVRDLVKVVLVTDQQSVSTVVTQLCRTLAHQHVSVISASVRTQMWQKMYRTIRGDDSDGVAALITVLARSAHMDSLHEQAFKAALDDISARSAFKGVNQSFQLFRNGFLDSISKYSNYTSSSKALDLLQRPGLIKDVVKLMFSPSEEVHSGAQTLVGQAFDVDGRLDCFRALLENLPDATLEGIFDVLETFIQYAPLVPEACSLSKFLVLCLTDIFEVLCSTSDGLLRHPQFSKRDDGPGPVTELPKFWTLITQAIGLIFKRTPTWSVYFDNEEMILWMRDALIFGRDMLAQREFLASVAANGEDQPRNAQSGAAKRSKRLGRKMIEDLQPVLPELVRWLRLTNDELLYQSFSLVQSLLECFRRAGIPPAKELMEKLHRHVQDGRNKQQKQTRLDASRIDKLEQCLAAFDDSDDEVEIVEVKPVPAKEEKPRINRKTSQTLSVFPEASTSSSAQGTIEKKRDVLSVKTVPTRQSAASDLRKGEALPAIPRVPPRSHQVASNGLPKPHAVHGTDPKTSKAESSSSEGEDSEGDEAGSKGLASLSNLQSTPKIKKPVERRQIKILDIPTEKNPMQERLNRRDDLRRTTLRLKPDISGLHRVILSWNYDHEGDKPPLTSEARALIRVPDFFRDHRQYQDVFEPLLLLECWAQIVQSKEEPADTYACMLASRQFVDHWVDVDINITDSVGKDWRLSETDIVLLRQPDSKRSMLAKVQSFKTSPMKGIQATIRCHLDRMNADGGLQLNTVWNIKKVFR
jgi:senataxin